MHILNRLPQENPTQEEVLALHTIIKINARLLTRQQVTHTPEWDVRAALQKVEAL